MVRHLYFPCVRAGLSRGQCVFVVFFFSALFHELLVSVPFHMPRLYAFGAMLGQIPLVFITKKLEDSSEVWRGAGAGNFLFWATFCVVGQPMAVLLYYYDHRVALMTGGQVRGRSRYCFTRHGGALARSERKGERARSPLLPRRSDLPRRVALLTPPPYTADAPAGLRWRRGIRFVHRRPRAGSRGRR